MALSLKLSQGILEEEWAKRSSVLPAQPPPSAKSSLTKGPSTAQKQKATQALASPSLRQTPSRPVVPTLPVMVPSASASSQAPQEGDGDVDMDGNQSDNDGEGGTFGYQGPQTAVIRDAESDNIVYQLERGLHRWPGYGEHGWYENQNTVRVCNGF